MVRSPNPCKLNSVLLFCCFYDDLSQSQADDTSRKHSIDDLFSK